MLVEHAFGWAMPEDTGDIDERERARGVPFAVVVATVVRLYLVVATVVRLYF